MEKVRPRCGQPSDRGRLKNITEHPATFLRLTVSNRAPLDGHNCAVDWTTNRHKRAWNNARFRQTGTRMCLVVGGGHLSPGHFSLPFWIHRTFPLPWRTASVLHITHYAARMLHTLYHWCHKTRTINNNNSHDNVYGAVIMTQSHCES